MQLAAIGCSHKSNLLYEYDSSVNNREKTKSAKRFLKTVPKSNPKLFFVKVQNETKIARGSTARLFKHEIVSNTIIIQIRAHESLNYHK